MQSWRDIDGRGASRLLLIADHASNAIPDDIDLDIDPALLSTHIAIDLGVASLAAVLCEQLDCPAILGGLSRLVVDLNREEEAPHIIPTASDGHAIPGNAILHEARLARIERFWRPYHERIAEQIDRQTPKMLISLHSFTPNLATRPEEHRPWQIGILYNRDDRAARIAIPLLEAAGVIVGDQLPYSGTILNATMNRHGEANSIAYLGVEVRQDQIADDAGVSRWAVLLSPVIEACLAGVTARAAPV